MRFIDKIREANWRLVDDELDRFAKEAAEPVAMLYEAAAQLPFARSMVHRLYFQPELQTAFLYVPDANEKLAGVWGEFLSEVPGVVDVLVNDVDRVPPDYGESPWIFIKKSFDPMSAVAQAGGWKEGPVTKAFGGPSPLGAALASGLLGAGAGYGAGWVGEHLLPEDHFAKGHLRRTGALAGGALGALPALWWGSLAHRFSPEKPGWGAWVHGWPFRKEDQALANQTPISTGEFNPAGTPTGELKMAVDALIKIDPSALSPYMEKFAEPFDSQTGLDDLDQIPYIPREQFNRSVWDDENTPQPIRATTTGVVNAASMSQGGAHYVSPIDVARIGLGMGSGWASGMLVGKTLGALAGLRPESQKKLQQAGVWAGLLTNVVPMIFQG